MATLSLHPVSTTTAHTKRRRPASPSADTYRPQRVSGLTIIEQARLRVATQQVDQLTDLLQVSLN